MPSLIKLKQGLFSNLPALQTGEPGFCTDTFHLYVGSGSGNKKIGANADTLETRNAAYLMDRANHTNTQLASTVSDFAEAAQDAVGAILDTSSGLTAGDVQFNYSDSHEVLTAVAANGASKTGDAELTIVGTGLGIVATDKLRINQAGLGTEDRIVLTAVEGGGNTVVTFTTNLTYTYTDASVTDVVVSDVGLITGVLKAGSVDYGMIAGGSLVSDLSNATSTTLASSSVIKTYVDNVAQGLNVKGSVRAATTAPLAATYLAKVLTASADGVLELDGILNLANGQKVLVKNQTGLDEKYNGIYDITSKGAVDAPFVLTRAANFDGTPVGEVTGGAYVFVEEGTTQADQGYVVVSDSPIDFDVDPIEFVQFSGAGQVLAGDGLAKTGNTLSVKYDNSTIALIPSGGNAGKLYVPTSGITATQIAAGAVSAVKLNADTAGAGLVLDGVTNALNVNVGDGIELGGTGADYVKVKLDGSSLAVSGTGLKVSAVNASVVAVSNLDTADFAAGIIVTTVANDSDTTIPTEAAVKDYTDALAAKLALTTVNNGASNIGIYDPTNLINATNVTAALLELATDIDGITGGSTEAVDAHARVLGSGFADVGVITVSGTVGGTTLVTSATVVGSVAAGDVIKVGVNQYTVSAVTASDITIFDTLTATVTDVQLQKASSEVFTNQAFTDGQFASLTERLVDIESKLDILKGRVDVVDGGSFI